MADLSTATTTTLDPFRILGDFKTWIWHNEMVMYGFVALLIMILAVIGWEMYKAYMATPKRERTFRKGKTNILAGIREEMINNMKRKKKWG